ncbi:alpha/beta hydrolase [Flammeovirgaceae bacterium SG7u.111]|nr:alpha/beta hydrolase [Flammeovirgaceae bacterium SG7u.132]WPO38162.1 alpha/beta hydrolase [Flammeovirgaceae bacterium SG7u.111]
MKLTFLTTLLALLTFTNFAQTTDTLYLWAGEVPGEKDEKHAAVQTDNTAKNVTRLTDVTNPILIAYEPEKQNDSGAAIIISPGGGYHILAIDLEGYEIAKWFNDLGYTAFVLQYRVPQKREGALNDIQRAIRLVRGNTDKYNLNPEKIGVLGFSAGGSLSARASTNFMKNTYPKIDEMDSLSCRPDFSMLIYPAYLDDGENRSLSPELTITEKTPPFFLFGTADDKYGNSNLVMATALRDNNIPVELHFLPKGGHGYGMRQGNIAAETWPALAEKWLDELLKNME